MISNLTLRFHVAIIRFLSHHFSDPDFTLWFPIEIICLLPHQFSDPNLPLRFPIAIIRFLPRQLRDLRPSLTVPIATLRFLSSILKLIETYSVIFFKNVIYKTYLRFVDCRNQVANLSTSVTKDSQFVYIIHIIYFSFIKWHMPHLKQVVSSIIVMYCYNRYLLV